jgi:hypothetical protein
MKRKAQSEKRKISAGGGREKSSKLLVLSFGFALCVLSFTLNMSLDIRLSFYCY